eukprot:gnl/TRDRNA2_/TRDRNA2_194852_c0_seq1.p1 gnl/TRDRNA2_/TRDRNA2_194852_c0~~gnl/TRDRNA2_/TRDRNA2_194852_c0_seq1.p1  ORF type:complete len:315 (+),score=39.32 gnl/TRDRNA2_/TRDRNA2_194852_c0_seq1:97-945(+)
MADDEDYVRPPNHAKVEDDFLVHPESGAHIRNPLCSKNKAVNSQHQPQPVLFSVGEYSHNCLDDALSDWHCISVSEASFRNLVKSCSEVTLPSAGAVGRDYLGPRRATLGRLKDLPQGFDFVVSIKKSSYVPPRSERRRPAPKEAHSIMVEKLNLEVTEFPDGKRLKVENVVEGLLAVWNRAHPNFSVRPGDEITRVNHRRLNAAQMLEEMQTAPDVVRLTIHRAYQERRGSKELSAEDLHSLQNARPSMARKDTHHGQEPLSGASLAAPDPTGAPRKQPVM